MNISEIVFKPSSLVSRPCCRGWALTACRLFLALQTSIQAGSLISGAPPVITVQPASTTASVGGTASFAVTVTSSSALVYQWYFNSARISKATNSTYTVTKVASANAGSYYVAITNTGGSLNSSTATLTVTLAPPVITTQPASTTATLGNSASFSVTVTNTTSLAYQWYFNGAAISRATNSTYTITNTAYASAGSYGVTITNTGGSVTSATAKLNVTPPATDVLSAPWVSADIGAVGLTGSAYNVTNLYTVNGSGASLNGTSDQFHYVYQTLPGNGSIAAKVVNQSGTNAAGYAGIMIRETTAVGASFMFAARQGNGALVARSRTSTGGATASTNGPSLVPPNYWLELVRTGTNISALASTNGSTWVSVKTNSFTMATNVTFGLFVSSGNTNVLDSDVFTNITVVP